MMSRSLSTTPITESQGICEDARESQGICEDARECRRSRSRLLSRWGFVNAQRWPAELV